MRLILRVDRYEFAQYKRPDSADDKKTPYIRLRGTDSHGQARMALIRGAAATALDRALEEAVPEGQEIQEAGVYTELRGEMVEFKPSGEELDDPYFRGFSFSLLSGPILELRQARYNAERAIDEAAALVSQEDYKQAYERLLVFAEAAAKPSVEAVQKQDVSHEQRRNAETQRAPDEASKAAPEEVPEVDDSQPDAAKEAPAASDAEDPEQPVNEESVTADPEREALEKLDGEKVFSDTADPETRAAREMGLNEAEEAPAASEAAPPEEKTQKTAGASDPFGSGDRKEKPKATANRENVKKAESKPQKSTPSPFGSPFASPFGGL